jgi:hypothetical protein
MIALMLIAAASVAAAAPKTIVRFDGDTIDGELMRPEGDLVAARPRLDMPNLVEAPRSFGRASRKTLLSAAAALEANVGGNDGGNAAPRRAR